MRISKWIVLASTLLCCCSYLKSAPTYESYLESWDSKWQSALTGMPSGPGGSPTYSNVTLNISFAAYVFTPSTTNCAVQNTSTCPNLAACLNTTNCISTFPFTSYLNGIQFSPCDALCIVNYVHAHGGKVKISYGGASYAPPYAPYYFISQTPGWPGNASTLAQGVIDVVSQYGFDGVDFDIEDPLPSGTTPQQFANQLITFLQYVKSGLPVGKTISLTIPAQGWGTYWMPLAQQAAAMNLVNYINFMEYDIWVNSSLPNGYPEQIMADITTYTASTNTSPAPNYSQGWGIPASLIQLGLMPGYDDTNQYLSVSDASGLTSFAVSEGLFGVMTWDLDRDAQTNPYPPLGDAAPYEYTTTIRQALVAPPSFAFKKLSDFWSIRSVDQGDFIRQLAPLHGAPPTFMMRPSMIIPVEQEFNWPNSRSCKR